MSIRPVGTGVESAATGQGSVGDDSYSGAIDKRHQRIPVLLAGGHEFPDNAIRKKKAKRGNF